VNTITSFNTIMEQMTKMSQHTTGSMYWESSTCPLTPWGRTSSSVLISTVVLLALNLSMKSHLQSG